MRTPSSRRLVKSAPTKSSVMGKNRPGSAQNAGRLRGLEGRGRRLCRSGLYVAARTAISPSVPDLPQQPSPPRRTSARHRIREEWNRVKSAVPGTRMRHARRVAPRMPQNEDATLRSARIGELRENTSIITKRLSTASACSTRYFRREEIEALRGPHCGPRSEPEYRR